MRSLGAAGNSRAVCSLRPRRRRCGRPALRRLAQGTDSRVQAALAQRTSPPPGPAADFTASASAWQRRTEAVALVAVSKLDDPAS